MNKEKYLYETNDSHENDFVMWMAFPGIYAFSLSSLGYLWMFKTIDELEGVSIERICSDTEITKHRKERVNLFGFSFSFDMDFLTIFNMIEKYNVPLLASKRGEEHPLIFAGGPVVTANPLPYSEYFDFFIIGDGEDVNLKVCKYSKENKEKPEKKF